MVVDGRWMVGGCDGGGCLIKVSLFFCVVACRLEFVGKSDYLSMPSHCRSTRTNFISSLKN
jgi:hypothetical protein